MYEVLKMRETVVRCNICELPTEEVHKMYGIHFSTEHDAKMTIEPVDSADIHLCDVCLIALKTLELQPKNK